MVRKDITPPEPENRPPVEVEFSKKCWHGCFTLKLGSKSIWRIPGFKPFEIAENKPTAVHVALHHPEERLSCHKECFP